MGFLVIIMFTFAVMIVFGSFVYFAERGTWDASTGFYLRAPLIADEPAELTPFTSIPQSFWWYNALPTNMFDRDTLNA